MDNELLKEKLKDISILCVEDEDGIREFIVSTLKYYFKEVYEASNGLEALEMYEEFRPKIILSDIEMPKMNGLEFVKRIRQNDLSTSIIMLTAYSNEEYLMSLINLNIDHFILKPLNSKKLNEALSKYIERNFSEQISLSENLKLDLSKRELIFEDCTIIPLRRRENDFLNLLYKNKNAITTYEQIEMELWQDKIMTSHAIKSFIKELRNKMPINIIKNVSQAGYILEQ
ncbi:response regulator receiver protein [Arcobacter nitrofigilis DSM 7299]|uniref:Response regulator receiver protein n=1 Tax=Arcobacter nitrofigilis (strain ATCC 33309 / DSM 7299 / CCUG 15893 / LMG 7604 / NCTC 12251 / CI) TaxID=572480 RepID=D5V3Z0_ARCNC|nr:response regulator [Arcobacter nitrofigilis]ADG92818.1 response regulator receiver protein [Arcobacter nitrofigilis DSM 7299]